MINKDGQKQIPEKGPVMLLYELFNNVNIECAASDGAQHSRFKMIATVNDKKFEGTGFYDFFYLFILKLCHDHPKYNSKLFLIEVNWIVVYLNFKKNVLRVNLKVITFNRSFEKTG